MLENEKEQSLDFFRKSNKNRTLNCDAAPNMIYGVSVVLILLVVFSLSIMGVLNKKITHSPDYKNISIKDLSKSQSVKNSILEIKSQASIAKDILNSKPNLTNSDLLNTVSVLNAASFLNQTSFIDHTLDRSSYAKYSVRQLVNIRENLARLNIIKAQLSTLPLDSTVQSGYLASVSIYLEEIINY